MAYSFVYRGNATIGNYVRERLMRAGWDPCEAVDDADAIITYFTSQTALEDEYFDEGGIVQKASKNAMLIDLSPSTPSFSRELSAIAFVNDLRPIEAPLAVVDPTEEDAFRDKENVMCFLACEKGDVEDAREIIDLIAGDVVEVGSNGSAQLARASRTVQTVALMMGVVESDALYRATRASTSSLDHFEGDTVPLTELSERVLDSIDDGRFSSTYTNEIFLAEISAAMTAADDVDLILPQLEAVMHLVEIMCIIGGDKLSPAALSLLYREEGAGADQGLDWSRAEKYYEVASNHHGSDDDYDDYDDDDVNKGYNGFNDFPGNFGGYSSN